MNVVKRVMAVLAGALLAVTVATAAPMPAQAQAQAQPRFVDPAVAAAPATAPAGLAWDDRTGIVIQAWSCESGDICFWTGPDGTGSRCAWSGNDSDWATGSTVCSWALTTNVKSVWNNGQSSTYTGVAYYLQTGYTSRVGCTRRGQSGNLAGTYKVRSHRWITTSCG